MPRSRRDPHILPRYVRPCASACRCKLDLSPRGMTLSFASPLVYSRNRFRCAKFRAHVPAHGEGGRQEIFGPHLRAAARRAAAAARRVGQAPGPVRWRRPFRSADVAEPIHVLIIERLRRRARRRARGGAPSVLVDVVDARTWHGDSPERVDRRVSVIGDDWRTDETRKLEPAVAVGRAHHGDLDMLVAETGDTARPFAFDRRAPFQFEAELDERNRPSHRGLRPRYPYCPSA